MAPEREEVVVDAHTLQPQHLGKQRAQHLLLRRARPAPDPWAVSSGAGSARRSSLPFGVSGKPIQHHERRRHHVVRKAPPNMRPQRRSIGNVLGGRHHIGHQPLVAGLILARNHRACATAG